MFSVFFKRIGLISCYNNTFRQIECFHRFEQPVIFACEVLVGYLVTDLDGMQYLAFFSDNKVTFSFSFVIANVSRFPAQMQEDEVFQFMSGVIREVGRGFVRQP